MAKSTVQTFGPNNTPLTTIRNTAVKSWNGFAYQGICALYVALSTILRDFDGSKDLLLGLEGYEDFVIQDGKGHILGFHQCKCYAKPANLTKEYMKMEDKRAYWCSQGVCAAEAPLYFHCNQTLTFSNGVQHFSYHNGSNVASPVGIYGLVCDVINDILKAQNIPASHVTKTAQLIYMIESHVSWLHQLSMTQPAGKDAFDIVTTHPIRFQQIIDGLTDTSSQMDKHEQARYICYYFQMVLEERMMKGKPNDGRVRTFISELGKLDTNQLLDLMQQLNPDVRIGQQEAEHEIVASPRINNLYRVLTETIYELSYPHVKWWRDGSLFSPSTLGNDISPDDQSAYIVSNMDVAALLWDCRWIVGRVESKVDDVRVEAQNITSMPIDYTKFTKPGKLGILTIEDFNNGNY